MTKRNKWLILGILGLVLTGCASGGKEVAKIGETVITDKQVEDVLYYLNAPSQSETLISDILVKKEFKDEWKDEMEAYKEEVKARKDEYETVVKDSGYESVDAYFEAELENGAKQNIVLEHYLKDNDSVWDNYTPVKAEYAILPTKDEANAVLEQMKAGISMTDAMADREEKPTTEILTSKSETLDSGSVNAIYANESEMPSEPYQVSESDFLIYKKVKTTRDDLVSKVLEVFLQDTDNANKYVRSLAKKYELKLHDEDVYKFIKNQASHLLWEIETDEEKVDREMQEELEKQKESLKSGETNDGKGASTDVVNPGVSDDDDSN